MPPISFVRSDALCAWKGPSLLVVNPHGECQGSTDLSGYYYRETRFIRTLRFTVNGRQPWLCDGSTISAERLAFTFVHPELTAFGGGGSGQSDEEETNGPDGIAHRSIALRLQYAVDLCGLRISLELANHGRRAASCAVACHMDADFADLQEALAGRREQDARIDRRHASGELVFIYTHPQLAYRTRVKFIGSGWQLSDRDATVLVQVRPRETVELALEVEPIDPGHVVSVDDRQAREQHLARWRAVMTRIDCPAAGEAAAVLRSAITDFASLASLEGAADEWLTCQAGMPLYPALFGRDALTGGWQAAILDRGASLDASLTFFGRLQAARVDDWRDAEPGRIPHSVRRGPLARANLNPYACYYGDFAGPLMFVISLAHLYAWTGDLAIVRRHWDSARRVLEWARTRGDRDRDGYLEYETRSRLGTRNQGWKDSGDAVVYDDGSAVPTPIATCELQGYWFAAQQLMAVMSVPMGQFGEARALWRSAMALKARFNRDWWVEEAGSIAFAMDPDKTLVRVGTSNVGHCVASGIIDDMHLPRVVGRLFAPDLFSGWGIRTLSSEHRFYDPLSYHRGSVWPVEQSTIAFGLRRFGFDSRAHDLAQAMFDLAGLYPGYRVPECIGGYPRRPASAPAAYPRANAPQLWNVCAYPLLVHTLLGLQPVAPLDLLVVDPALPSWLPEVVLHDLRLAGATATLRFWRSAEGSSHVEILKKRGTLRIVKQPPPESLSAGLRDRMTALVDTVMH